jgi:hypothetical protein
VITQLNHNVIKVRVVAVRFDDEGLQIIRQNHLGESTKKTECLVDAVDKICRALTRQRDGKGVLRKGHHAD